MIDEHTLRYAAALAEPGHRMEAARRLAEHIGVEAVLILVEDPEVDALVPAPGFPPTLPGGAGWRRLLQQAGRPGVHPGEVGYPTATRIVPAAAVCARGPAVLLVGGAADPPVTESLTTLAPLLASLLRAEHATVVARGELRVAQDHARQAQNLARALDAARSEVERTLRELEKKAGELQQARTRAEEAIRAKDEFLAMLGHELRNPLSPILTALQLMRLKNQASREQDVIERQVASLMRLVDDLLDVSRITRGKIELRKERVELAEVAARAIELSSPVLEAKRQVLQVDIPSRGCVVDADPSRLAQVLANLLTNAGKYSDAETQIRFSAEQDDAHVRIRVRDQGIGIPPEMLHEIFDMFVQQGQSLDRSQGGLGLGLAIVRSLVSMHEGTVQVFSQGPGKGSEFVVQLPRPAAPVARARSSLPAGGHEPRRAGAFERILVVDDNDDAAQLISEALRLMGYEVQTAGDGPSALRRAEEFQPQVALLDIGLPVMDGYELAERLRRQRPASGPRLVAVTGYGQGDDRRRALEVGFEAHLVKPIALEQLQQVLVDLQRAASPPPASRG
jgi:signal transduction histidine kinase/ActR/RegA family two-component response regulator